MIEPIHPAERCEVTVQTTEPRAAPRPSALCCRNQTSERNGSCPKRSFQRLGVGGPAAVSSVQRGDAGGVGDPGDHGRRPAVGAPAEDRRQRSSRGDGAARAAGRSAGVTWRGRVTTNADGSLPALTRWA